MTTPAKPGRKLSKAIDVQIVDPSLDQAQIGSALVQMRTNGVVEQQERSAAIFEIGCRVGAIQLSHVQRDFLRAAEIRLFEDIKNFKQYKDLAIKDKDGNLRTAENLVEFCALVFGVSYSVLAEQSQNLNLLGESAYESANRLGLNRKQMRLIRSLPDAQRTAVAEAIQAESKSEVVAIIEDLAAQLAQANDDLAEAGLKAADDKELIAGKDQKINTLTKKLKRIDNAPPEEQLALVLSETTERAHIALSYVRGDLNTAFSKLAGFERGGANSHRNLMAGWLGDLEREIAILRADYFLPQTVVTPGTGPGTAA